MDDLDHNRYKYYCYDSTMTYRRCCKNSVSNCNECNFMGDCKTCNANYVKKDGVCEPNLTACAVNQITTQKCKDGVACVETDDGNCLCPSGVKVISTSCRSSTSSRMTPIKCPTGYNLTCPDGYRLDTETNLCHAVSVEKIV